MLEDLETLIREFDVRALLSPHSPEQLLINLVIIAILAGTVTIAWKALARLF